MHLTLMVLTLFYDFKAEDMPSDMNSHAHRHTWQQTIVGDYVSYCLYFIVDIDQIYEHLHITLCWWDILDIKMKTKQNNQSRHSYSQNHNTIKPRWIISKWGFKHMRSVAGEAIPLGVWDISGVQLYQTNFPGVDETIHALSNLTLKIQLPTAFCQYIFALNSNLACLQQMT